MSRARTILTATATLVLAGCGGASSDYNHVEVSPDEARAQAAIERSVAENGVDRTALTGVPVSKPTPDVARGRAFPTEFQGYWGVTPNDCELANTDATGRLAVDVGRLRFYDARADVREMHEVSRIEVVARLAFARQRERWQGVNRFRLEAGGMTLLRIEQPGGATVRYQRC